MLKALKIVLGILIGRVVKAAIIRAIVFFEIPLGYVAWITLTERGRARFFQWLHPKLDLKQDPCLRKRPEHVEYDQSEIWKHRKACRLSSADFRCSIDGCPNPATDVWYLNYDRWGTGEELDSDLAPLCDSHYAIAERDEVGI